MRTEQEGEAMDDERIQERIERLVAEEHGLREREAEEDAFDPSERERLQAIGVELDRCWDLLRQRRARREAGLDPDEASARPADTVEDYLQ
jgi:3-oxoacyl-ACP reductase-like protein